MISNVETLIPPIPMIHEHSLRRQLKAELLELKRDLDHIPLDDEMTIMIEKWHFHFTQALNTCLGDSISVNERMILDKFIGSLKEILQDPFGCPLEEISYLGNDGEIYGYKALCFYLSSMPSELAGKSPFHSDQDKQFTVSLHPIVKAVAEWLKKRGSPLETHPNIEQKYQELIATDTLPKMPTPDRIRFQERLRRLDAERVQSRSAVSFTILGQQDIDSRIDQLFEGIHTQATESIARGNERAESIRTRDVRLRQELEREVAQLDQEIEEINLSIGHLKSQLEDVESKLSDQDKEMLRVRLEMERLRAEIKRRKKKKRLALIRTICIVAACIIAPFLLPEGMALGATNGGASLTFAL